MREPMSGLGIVHALRRQQLVVVIGRERRAEFHQAQLLAVIVEEGWRFCGLGAQIAESVYSTALDFLDAPIRRVTGEDVPMPYSRPLEDAAIPNKARVIEAVKSIL